MNNPHAQVLRSAVKFYQLCQRDALRHDLPEVRSLRDAGKNTAEIAEHFTRKYSAYVTRQAVRSILSKP